MPGQASGTSCRGGRVTTLPAVPPAARGHMAVVLVGKVRHRACLTVRVGVAEALRKRAGARTHVRPSSPLPPICCCGGALLALVAACPAALARSRHSQGWLSPHNPSGLGRHVKGHVDSGPFGVSPPLAASSSALPSGRGCPRGRETDRDGPDAPCAPLGCHIGTGAGFITPSAMPCAGEEAGGAFGPACLTQGPP